MSFKFDIPNENSSGKHKIRSKRLVFKSYRFIRGDLRFLKLEQCNDAVPIPHGTQYQNTKLFDFQLIKSSHAFNTIT